MITIRRRAIATALFATIVTALVLTATQSPVLAEPLPVAPVAAQASTVVHQLPRVVLTGRVQHTQDSSVIELPRVVVTARRVDPEQTLLTQASPRTAPRS